MQLGKRKSDTQHGSKNMVIFERTGQSISLQDLFSLRSGTLKGKGLADIKESLISVLKPNRRMTMTKKKRLKKSLNFQVTIKNCQRKSKRKRSSTHNFIISTITN
jgi:hypothetical protein